MKYGHLEQFNLTLRVLSPVFIGSGRALSKKEYIFDPEEGTVSFPDFPRLVAFLKSKGLLAQYEKYLTQERHNDFRRFLAENKITRADYKYFVSYKIPAGEAAHDSNFREVLTFIKDPTGYPYIPGSSLKGAIRTALGAYLLKKDNFAGLRREIETADSSGPPRRYLQRESSRLEEKLFYRLDIKDSDGRVLKNAVNDFMQGIRISDSAPIGFENLTLAGKYDRRPDGTETRLPVFREVLIPGSEARFSMTLDIPILTKAGIDLQDIEDALHSFADEHYANFEEHFVEKADDADISTQDGVDLILGGGAGYVSKTLTYNLFPERERGVKMVEKIMVKQFPRHKHDKDAARYKVSPHMLKTTMYGGQYYQMGRCELLLK